MDLRPRVVVPKSHERSHEFREGARHGDVEHERPSREEHAVEGLYQRRVQDDRCSAWLPPGAPRRSQTTAQSWRPQTRSLSPGSAAAAQDAHHGGAQQHVRVAALVHRAGRPRVVHLVEALHGLVLVVLAALQQVMHGHGATVVVNVVAALAVGEDLDPLDKTGVAGASGLVASVFLTLKAILIDSGSMNDVPLVRGMRQTLKVAGEKELSELGKYCTSCRAVT